MTVLVTYNAPEGDSEVVTYMGLKLFNGQPVEVDPVENSRLLSKIRGNKFFEVERDDEDDHGLSEESSFAAESDRPYAEPKRRGRPPGQRYLPKSPSGDGE